MLRDRYGTMVSLRERGAHSLPRRGRVGVRGKSSTRK
jgi:hypothetical protein